MATAGSIVVDLLMRTGSFETDSKRAEKRVREMDKAFQATGKAIGTAIAAGAGVAATGLALVIKSTIEAEKAQAQLDAVLKSTKGAAGLAADEILALSSELQKMSTFGDESITSAQSLLLTFTQIGRDVFPAATQSVLDMATALDKDLNSAAQMVGKALNDPVKGVAALAEAGVQFSKDQRQMIETLSETGRVADAQRIILKELETQFGGSAKAARDTLGGAFEALKNAAGDLLEGEAGSFKGLQAGVNSLTATLESSATRSAFANLVSDMASVANAAANAITWIDKMRQVSQLGSGSLALGDASSEALKERRKQLQANIDLGKQWRQEEGNLLERLSGGRDFSAYDAMVDEVRRIDALLNYQSSSTGNGRGRGVQVNIRPPASAPAPAGGGGGKGRGSGRDAYSLADSLIADREALAKLVEEEARAREQFEAMAAQLSGPVADANYRYARDLEELNELAAKGAIGSDELTRAQENLRKEHEANVAAIQERLEPGKQLLKELQFELDLMKLTNAERATAIQLRGLDTEQIQKYGDAIAETNQKIMENAEQADFMDGWRGEFQDFFSDVLTGTKSIGDAFEDMLSNISAMIAERVAQNWVDQLFGQMGTTNGGAAGGGEGGWLASFASLFSNGYSEGGYTGPGRKKQPKGVVHAGEFVLSAEATNRLGIGYLESLNAGGSLWVGEEGPETMSSATQSMRIPQRNESRSAVLCRR